MKKYITASDELNPNSADKYTRGRTKAGKISDADLLSVYVYDPDPAVRYDALANPNTPMADIIASLPDYYELCLLHDCPEDVVSISDIRSDIPVSAWMQLYNDVGDDITICEILALLPDVPVDILRHIYEWTDDWVIRCNLAYNPNTPIDLIREMCSARDPDVREAARKSLAERGET